MVRRKEDIRVRQVEHAQGGKETVCFTDFLLPEDAPGHGRVISKLVIPPGASIGYHAHNGEFECIYVLDGEATVNDDGREVVLHPGDMHLCPGGQSHGTENRGERDLTVIALILNDLS
ncbi:MAG: cupin domain-containing protein [Oscillospiraceae bacterium]|nr:cupin domain-containing protein [Oscillospiraceae bacterium]